MNLNINQTLAITIAVLGVLMASTAQLTDLFGAGVAHTVVSVAGLLNSLIASILAVMTGNAGMVKSVAALPGVTRVSINADASQAVASVAVDPAQPKVGAASPELRPQLQAIAKG